MLKYKSESKFLIGLDTDEFLFSNDNLKNGLNPFDKDKILSVFDSYEDDETLFKIDYYPCSIVDPTNTKYINNKFEYPARNIVYFSNELQISENMNQYWKNISKYFSRSSAFISSSVGNHNIIVSYGKKSESKLGMLHFNATGKKRAFERAKIVIDGYKYFPTSLNIRDQIDILVANKKLMNYGHHKVNSYHYYLVRQFIVSLFIKYLKRLPELNELDNYVNNNINNNTNIIETNITSMKESSNDNNNIIVNEIEINNLVYYDEPLEIMCNKYPIFKISFLKELFEQINF
jgi:hypothetical protein